MATVTSDTEASAFLARFRGEVTEAGLTYPERAALSVTDPDGGQWCLTTWDADFRPVDPSVLLGKTVISANLDERSQILTVDFADGVAFTATPIVVDEEDLEAWDLFTPEGLVLEYGPRGRWHLGLATDVV